MCPRSWSTRDGSAAHGFCSGPANTVQERRPPARSTRRISASAAAGSAISMYPHRQRTPSNHLIRKIELLRVEHPELDVLKPELGRVALRRRDHRLREVANDHAAARSDERGSREAGNASARRQFENRLPAGRREPLEHPFRHWPRRLLEVGVAVVPSRRHRFPHGVTRASELDRVRSARTLPRIGDQPWPAVWPRSSSVAAPLTPRTRRQRCRGGAAVKRG
jgi:hypothetical protein